MSGGQRSSTNFTCYHSVCEHGNISQDFLTEWAWVICFTPPQRCMILLTHANVVANTTARYRVCSEHITCTAISCSCLAFWRFLPVTLRSKVLLEKPLFVYFSSPTSIFSSLLIQIQHDSEVASFWEIEMGLTTCITVWVSLNESYAELLDRLSFI